MRKTTLITDGAGYIGSHTALALINAGHHVVVLDKLCNSCRESIARLELLTHTRVDFISAMIGGNLGTGIGYSVLQIIHSFEDIIGITIPYRFDPRRKGDIAKFWADPSKAVRDLGWSAERDLEQMIVDTWRWQSRNPPGYQSSFERSALRAVK
jgi:UDP-glucose 4-epimerase